jgi:hypothetical protein
MVGVEPRRRWHDGRVRFLAAALAAVLLAAPGSAVTQDTTEPTQTTVAADQSAPSATDNPFLPENENVSDCLSALPPPDCGSEDRGGSGQYFAFGAMLLGMAFIGWRIARGVRRRDRVVSPD